MGVSYAWEKFFSAVHGAIGSERSPQKRLANAYVFDIIHVAREDVPNAEIWQRIQKLTDAVTCKPARGDEGTVEATTSTMSAEEAAKWLEEIVSLFSEIAEAYGASGASFAEEPRT